MSSGDRRRVPQIEEPHMERLRRIAYVVDNWSELLPFRRVFIFGSYVRGDNRRDSDLDIAIEFSSTPDTSMVRNWEQQNQTCFQDLKDRLDIRRLSLHSEEHDLAWPAIHAGVQNPVYSIGKVLCVVTPSLK
jgi:predicted nucleotidyltransferase